jgi:putative NADH-flavin reductase
MVQTSDMSDGTSDDIWGALNLPAPDEGNGIDVTEVVKDYEALVHAIGRVAMEAAHMERVAHSLLTALLGGGHVELLIVGQSFSLTYQGVRAVLAALPDTVDHRKAADLIEEANKLYLQRNEVIHADWLVLINRTWQGHVAGQYRRYGKTKFSHWNSEGVAELADRLDQVSIAMMELTRRMGFESPGPEPLF